ncbi:MAG: FHA domain-containing protein [Myxococcota bacterium]
MVREARHAHVLVRTSTGQEARLHAGDLVGRVPTAALLIDDPRVSEAHALVTLRRGRFVLLSLRRLLLVDGAPVREVDLRPELEVELAAGLTLEVRSLHVPETVLAVEAAGLGLRRLGPVASLAGGRTPAVWGRFEPSADAHVWSLAEGWRLRVGDAPATSLEAGQEIELRDQRFRFREVPFAASHPRSTQGVGPAPLRLVTFYDGIEIHREGHPVLTFGGLGARILSELAAFGGPVPWQTVAGEVWREEPGVDLRHRWDAAVNRLRRKLAEHAVRADLVRADGTGFFQLVLGPADVLEDRT